MRGHDVNLSSIPLARDSLIEFDAVLIVTNHTTINWNLIAKNAKLVIDTRNAMAGCDDIRGRLVKA